MLRCEKGVGLEIAAVPRPNVKRIPSERAYVRWGCKETLKAVRNDRRQDSLGLQDSMNFLYHIFDFRDVLEDVRSINLVEATITER